MGYLYKIQTVIDLYKKIKEFSFAKLEELDHNPTHTDTTGGVSMSHGEMLFQEAVDNLRRSKKSLRCSQVAGILQELGFDVRDGKRGGHKVFVHDSLTDFTSSSYNCGHGKNPEIKSPYITNILRILEEYRIDLIAFLNE